MTIKEFENQYEIAKIIVSRWPIWKQNLLEDSCKSSIDIPRQSINNLKLNNKS